MAKDTKPAKGKKKQPLAAEDEAKAKRAKAAKQAKARKAKAAALPVPAGLAVTGTKPPKQVLAAERRPLGPLDAALRGLRGDATILDRLWQTVEQRRLAGDVNASHSARLMARGTPKVAQKLGEEAVECVIEAVQGNREATVLESADVLYHLIVVWVDAGIRPEEVWTELARREGISGIVEKASRPKGIVRAARTTKLP
ncbi:phosphoribosyl-ATP diphosphatase [Roseomonas sp. OT10]|uniref:phosphoribosyl-ATP diphosphatase n=1 Tax=Roseomonas cutis TaxID=2897332 RepID=UPI001E387C47|nr:phosphoribosyl-ATP diphosphatase [Roseomonas sp. OT10]UFN47203.1 phosphoribosyl-ATP diphosphatase [Roseomonas sp. OT10]